jgi:hypothetical protein
MTTTVRAHFDGKHSLVLDEPVDLPIGTPLGVHVEPLPRATTPTTDGLLAPVIVGLDAALAQTIASDPDFDAENM